MNKSGQNFHEIDEPSSGCLLLSEPFLPDPNFERSVILLCEHNDKGSFGLVLNHKSGIYLPDLLNDNLLPDCPVFIGGPVEPNTLHYVTIGSNAPIDSRDLKNGIFWGGDFDDLRQKLLRHEIMPDEVRFFIGYSGWGADQLANEIEENAWMLCYGDNLQSLISETNGAQWAEVLKKMGAKYRHMANYPLHPSFN